MTCGTSRRRGGEFPDGQLPRPRAHLTPDVSHRGRRLKALEANDLDAFVYDKPLLTWLVVQDFSPKLRVLEIVLEREHYAIALPKLSTPLHRVINGALLEETETDWWDQTIFQYLGKKHLD
jgi:ABC-type amino acid transport substrate-binding protein